MSAEHQGPASHHERPETAVAAAPEQHASADDHQEVEEAAGSGAQQQGIAGWSHMCLLCLAMQLA